MKALLESTFVLIPARGGSKGVPDKNVRSFAGGPSLVERACDVALEVFSPEQIIVSSDSEKILEQARNKGVKTHFRPAELATDTSGMTEVMLNAAAAMDGNFRFLLLLQPTSPFRTAAHIRKALKTFREGDDGVVAMHVTKSHPQFTLFRPEGDYVVRYSDEMAVRRQDLPKVLEVNGLIYLLEIDRLSQPWMQLKKIRPLEVGKLEALDIDTPEDWWLAELIGQAAIPYPSN